MWLNRKVNPSEKVEKSVKSWNETKVAQKKPKKSCGLGWHWDFQFFQLLQNFSQNPIWLLGKMR